ncbi:casein kinase I [Drosophila elegans]|uniref:casein kinase I n=1 Tax=Drosophila elegans TaxID=30023 RepID=UPI0007E7BC4F|nr:casein kinase I [Drosophila elegans]
MAEPEKGHVTDERRWQGRPDPNRNAPRTRIRREQSHPPQSHHNREKSQRCLRRPIKSERSSNVPQPLTDTIVAGKYRLLNRIGNGSFGELYRAEGLKYGEQVAIKLERASVKYPMLPREAKIYGILRGGAGIPHVRHYATEGVHNVMVMDLLGPTLEDLLNFCSRTFSMKTTLMLADQILSRVEYLHRKCFIHRDIKPENFLMGLGRHRTQVFMIDFGLAKKFYSLHSQQHIGYRENRDLVGTARYASARAHYAEQGRRDDLESVGYLLLYFQRGRLPWQGIRAQSQVQKYERIAESKANLPLQTLCSGMPIEFYLYLKYCRNLPFYQKPDYVYLHQLFKVLFRNQMMLYDFQYDWVTLQRESKALCDKQKDEKVREKQTNGDRDRTRHGNEYRTENKDVEQARSSDRNRNTNRDNGLEQTVKSNKNRDRNKDRGKGRHEEDKPPKKERKACSCSYHRHKKHHRDRQLERQAERRRPHPEQPEEFHRVPPCL